MTRDNIPLWPNFHIHFSTKSWGIDAFPMVTWNTKLEFFTEISKGRGGTKGQQNSILLAILFALSHARALSCLNHIFVQQKQRTGFK